MEALAGKAILYLVLAGAVGGGLWWVKGRVDLSYAQEQTIAIQQQTIEDQQRAAERKAVTADANRLASEVANARIKQAQTEAAERVSAFTRRGEGRFERLLQAKPGLIVPRVNNGTERVFDHARCVASAGGPGACGVPASEPTDVDGDETSSVVEPARQDRVLASLPCPGELRKPQRQHERDDSRDGVEEHRDTALAGLH